MSGSPAGVRDGLVVEVPALRVVVRHRADERELHVRVLLLAPAGRRRSRRAGPSRVEARDLRQQRPLDVDPELVDDVRGVLGRERHVLRRQRVDRRRPDVARRQTRRRAARTRACGRSPRRSARATAARKSSTSRFGVERSMWQRQIQCARRVREVVDHRRRLRVVDDDEVVVVRRTRSRSARCSGGRSPPARRVRPCGLPWSALWIVFVTSKNSSSPWMIRHSTSSPASPSAARACS